jgi:hypothetical protein
VHQIGSKIKHTRRPLATGLYTVLCMGLEFLLSILRVVGGGGNVMALRAESESRW